MHYHIYCNQKNIGKNHQEVIYEFTKRLSAYCETSLHYSMTFEIPKDTNSSNHTFLFVGNGLSDYDSVMFSQYIDKLQNSGKSIVHIFIGYDESVFYQYFSGNNGKMEIQKISLSNAKLSPETKTILFYEQLYRGYTILQGKTYHK